eukprot:2503955-Rhodomonas_salina.1
MTGDGARESLLQEDCGRHPEMVLGEGGDGGRKATGTSLVSGRADDEALECCACLETVSDCNFLQLQCFWKHVLCTDCATRLKEDLNDEHRPICPQKCYTGWLPDVEPPGLCPFFAGQHDWTGPCRISEKAHEAWRSRRVTKSLPGPAWTTH